jgi:hypothetical protein
MIRAVAAFAVCFAAVLPLAAQYKDCSPPQMQGSYYLFVDDFRFADETTASPDMKMLRDALHGSVKSQLESMKLQNLPTLRTTPCMGRFPQAGDFNPQRVSSLNNRDVVMELWTVIRPTEEQRVDAEFNVILMPAFLRNLRGERTPGLLGMTYTLTKKLRQEQLLVLLRNHPELTAYALIGAGLRAIDNKDYDYANSFLCRGLAELQHAEKTPDNKKLFDYVDAATAQVVADAKRDGGYLGPLRLLSPGTKAGCAR